MIKIVTFKNDNNFNYIRKSRKTHLPSLELDKNKTKKIKM